MDINFSFPIKFFLDKIGRFIPKKKEYTAQCKAGGTTCLFENLPFHPMGKEHIKNVPEEIKKFIKEKNQKKELHCTSIILPWILMQIAPLS